jgi:hypothetical protein
MTYPPILLSYLAMYIGCQGQDPILLAVKSVYFAQITKTLVCSVRCISKYTSNHAATLPIGVSVMQSSCDLKGSGTSPVSIRGQPTSHATIARTQADGSCGMDKVP